MAARKIQATKDYRLFHRNTVENRPLDIKKHRKLKESMKLYGFLPSMPIVCFRDADGKLVVKDGQHRLAIAEELDLPVSWVEEPIDFDAAITSTAGVPWKLRDYAQMFASNGVKPYEQGLAFASEHGLPVGTAFSLLAGTTTFTNIQNQFIDGDFKIKDRAWADAVAGLYGPLTRLSPALKSARLIEACMAICRVAELDGARLLACAERCREKLVPYSTRDAYLGMLEEVYNFGRKQLLGLRSAAIQAMRERNIVTKAKKGKAEAAAVSA